MGLPGRERGFLSLLPAPIFERLASDAVQMRYDDGQQIHARGEKKPGFSMIRKGKVRLGSISPNGSFVEFGLLRAGDVYGEMTVISGIARVHDSYAVGPTIVDQLSAERFRALLDEFPALQSHLLKLMARRLQHTYQRIDDILMLPLIDRVGRHLLEIRRRISRSQSLPVKQSDLAEAMAASRVSISKVMAQLSELGFVATGYGRIHLNDPDALTAWLENRHHIAPPIK
jgi:CRP/FNR family transcriptional regulator, cyclic AMP receptor protein